MNKPFFSVIVPEHNSAEWMRTGLDSIRAQTFKDYQLIIVCDRCADNTAEIAEEYLKVGDTMLEIDNGCCAAARNAGMDFATGKWILFMDDDDWFNTDKAFELIAAEIAKYEKQEQTIDILAFGFYWDGIGYRMNSPERLYTAVWNKCWRREFIERIGARFPMWKHSDDEGFSRLTHKKAHIRYLDANLYYYNFMREGSLTWQIENGLIDGHIPEE